MELDWEDIRYFLAVYREGSLSSAARSLGVHASTVSRRLESLEECVGGVLFRRGPDGLTATETALKMVAPGLSAQRQMQLIRELTSGESSLIEGRVRISVTTTFDEYFLSRQIPLLVERHPKLVPHVSSGSALVDLVAGDADVAVRFSADAKQAPVPSSQQDGLRAKKIGVIDCHVYSSRHYLEQNHFDSTTGIENFDFVVPSETWMPGAKWLNRLLPEEKKRVHSNYFGGTLDMVEEGVGAGILPAFVAARGRDLVRLEGPGTVDRRYLWLLWPTDLKRVARVQAVVDFIIERVEAHREIFQDVSALPPDERR